MTDRSLEHEKCLIAASVGQFGMFDLVSFVFHHFHRIRAIRMHGIMAWEWMRAIV